ncbi:MAG: sugar kinase [Anaerolineae bacterium]|nr:sugar kinase [Anaerolineae bacterium]
MTQEEPLPLDIIAIGEALVEIMRPEREQPLDLPAPFVGPFPSGAPAIFADAAARLGARTGFIGVVGDDDFGLCLRRRLTEDGLELACLRVSETHTTGCAFVAYFDDGSRRFLFHLRHAAAGTLSPEDVPSEYFRGSRFLHVMGSALALSDASREACYRAVRLAKAAGARVSLDPNLRPELLGLDKVRAVCAPVLEVADVVLPSGAEARMLTGADDDEAAARDLARPGRTVALKRGEKGSVVFQAGERFEAAAFPVVEVDPTGAGDCYDAAFLVGMLRGWDLSQVARFANAAGALAVTRLGPMEGAPRLDEALALAGIASQ